MNTEQESNKWVVRQLIEEAINRGNFEVVDRLIADQLVEHDPHQVAGASPRQAFIDAVNVFRQAFPDQQTVVDEQVAEGDRVATRWHMTGTHSGTFMGIAATGRRVNLAGIFWDRLKDGRMVETWANYDLFGLIQQIR